MNTINFDHLIQFLARVPAVKPGIGKGQYEDKNWWIKFSIDITHELAWNVIQEFGHILNYISLEQRLPATFYPVSAPPYMNGGPQDHLYWIIESKVSDFTPDNLKEYLAGHLPDPVDSIEEWNLDE